MNALQQVIIEKAGNDNGFEHVESVTADTVTMASARHRTRVVVFVPEAGYRLTFTPEGPLGAELIRTFPLHARGNGTFEVGDDVVLGTLLARASALARSLPDQPAADFGRAVIEALTAAPSLVSEESLRTEVERMVRQRIGQDRFRDALLGYWGGACAVTGVAVPEVLRASHTKPWAECESDEERLDVFNGFLLCANLDALFDRHLITFARDGTLVAKSHLTSDLLRKLGVEPGVRLRWIAPGHERYLASHRERL